MCRPTEFSHFHDEDQHSVVRCTHCATGRVGGEGRETHLPGQATVVDQLKQVV